MALLYLMVPAAIWLLGLVQAVDRMARGRTVGVDFSGAFARAAARDLGPAPFGGGLGDDVGGWRRVR